MLFSSLSPQHLRVYLCLLCLRRNGTLFYGNMDLSYIMKQRESTEEVKRTPSLSLCSNGLISPFCFGCACSLLRGNSLINRCVAGCISGP